MVSNDKDKKRSSSFATKRMMGKTQMQKEREKLTSQKQEESRLEEMLNQLHTQKQIAEAQKPNPFDAKALLQKQKLLDKLNKKIDNTNQALAQLQKAMEKQQQQRENVLLAFVEREAPKMEQQKENPNDPQYKQIFIVWVLPDIPNLASQFIYIPPKSAEEVNFPLIDGKYNRFSPKDQHENQNFLVAVPKSSMLGWKTHSEEFILQNIGRLQTQDTGIIISYSYYAPCSKCGERVCEMKKSLGKRFVLVYAEGYFNKGSGRLETEGLNDLRMCGVELLRANW